MSKKQRRKNRRAFSVFKASWFAIKFIFLIGIIGCFLAGGAVTGYVAALVKDEPVRPEDEIIGKLEQNVQSGFVYFNDNSLIGQLRSEEYRQLVEFEDIPEHIVDAFLAVEDSNFREHIGIDFTGLLRAVKQQVLNEPIQTGGSTITQQLARQVFLTLDQSHSRKAKEILLAMRIERFVTKDQILLAYLNKIPFGNDSTGNYVYGIQAAAEGIFDVKDLDELNIAQSAYLAGLPQDPNGYSAFNSRGEFEPDKFERAVKRQKWVLSRMLEVGEITQEQYDEALAFDLKASLAEPKQRAYNTYPFLLLEVEQRAAKLLLLKDNPDLTMQDLEGSAYAEKVNEAHKQLLRGGYHIHTTIDKTIYDKMQEIAKNPENFTPDHPEKGVEQIGAMMIENSTGRILGMIEGRDYHIEQLNHATQMKRQPGSTMKPIAAYLPAIESGKIQPASPIDDIPIMLEDWTKGYHIPNNWNMKFHGIITARTALNRSYNIPALKLFNEVIGIQQAWDFVKQLGVTTLTDQDQHARTGVIGGLEFGTTVEELTNAYAAIGNNGVFVDAYLISRIEDSDGKVVYEHEPEPKQVFSEETAFLMTDMLRTVLTAPGATGLTAKNSFKHFNDLAVAGKTGSTNLDRDAWFMGYSPDVTFGVWVGYDMPSTLTIGQGTLRAQKIWAMVMDAAYEQKPELFKQKTFERPSGVIQMTVSDVSGKLPTALTEQHGHLVTDWFNKKFIPTEEDDSLVTARAVRYNGVNYIANPLTPDDMVVEKMFIKRPEPVTELYENLKKFLDEVPDQHRPMINNRPGRLTDYYPEDWETAAPEKADPRKDDGLIPDPPSNVVIEQGEGRNKITFEPSPSEDVVGYRFYRSFNGNPFRTNPGQNVMAGDNYVVYDYVNSSYTYAYYITAVDVVGNESAPSQLVTTGDGYDDFDPLLPEHGNTGPGRTDEDGQDEQNHYEDLPEMPDPDSILEWEDAEGDDDEAEEAMTQNLPSVPSQVSIEHDGLLTVKISWKANPVAEQIERYEIYYSSSKDGNYRLIATSNATEYRYTHIRTSGWFRVAAVNQNGVSPPSAPVQLESDSDE